MTAIQLIPVEPKSLNKVIDHINQGGKVCIPTQYRMTIIDKKCYDKWEKAGIALFREEGNGYRMRTGKSSIYILPGQLRYM